MTERKPVLLVEKGAKFVEVDTEGVRFATVDKAPKGVPLLELEPEPSASLRRFGEDRLVREAVRVCRTSPRPWRPTRKPSGSSRTTPSPCGSPAIAW